LRKSKIKFVSKTEWLFKTYSLTVEKFCGDKKQNSLENRTILPRKMFNPKRIKIVKISRFFAFAQKPDTVEE